MSSPKVGQEPILSLEEALEIVTFLVSSAEICLREPRYYGTFRLIDGASRLIGMVLDHQPGGKEAAFLQAFRQEIDANKTRMLNDREAYYAFLRTIPAQAAAELKRVRAASMDEERTT